MEFLVKHKKTAICFTIIAVSIICNVAFLMQDFFPGRYYGKVYDDVSCSITVKGDTHETVHLDAETIWSGEVKKTYKESLGGQYTALYDSRDGVEILRLVDKTIMFKQDAITNNIYYCPFAIVIQILWIVGDLSIIYFGFIRHPARKGKLL